MSLNKERYCILHLENAQARFSSSLVWGRAQWRQGSEYETHGIYASRQDIIMDQQR